MLETLAFEFENKSDPFAIFNMVQSCGVLAMLRILDSIKREEEVFYFILASGILSILFCSLIFKFDFKSDYNKNKSALRLPRSPSLSKRNRYK